MNVKTPTVDRRLARAIAYKRIVTGTAGLACGVGLVLLVAARGAGPSVLLFVALLFFFGGGAWALRDGVRLHRELGRG